MNSDYELPGVEEAREKYDTELAGIINESSYGEERTLELLLENPDIAEIVSEVERTGEADIQELKNRYDEETVTLSVNLGLLDGLGPVSATEIGREYARFLEKYVRKTSPEPSQESSPGEHGINRDELPETPDLDPEEDPEWLSKRTYGGNSTGPSWTPD